MLALLPVSRGRGVESRGEVVLEFSSQQKSAGFWSVLQSYSTIGKRSSYTNRFLVLPWFYRVSPALNTWREQHPVIRPPLSIYSGRSLPDRNEAHFSKLNSKKKCLEKRGRKWKSRRLQKVRAAFIKNSNDHPTQMLFPGCLLISCGFDRLISLVNIWHWQKHGNLCGYISTLEYLFKGSNQGNLWFFVGSKVIFMKQIIHSF